MAARQGGGWTCPHHRAGQCRPGWGAGPARAGSKRAVARCGRPARNPGRRRPL